MGNGDAAWTLGGWLDLCDSKRPRRHRAKPRYGRRLPSYRTQDISATPRLCTLTRVLSTPPWVTNLRLRLSGTVGRPSLSSCASWVVRPRVMGQHERIWPRVRQRGITRAAKSPLTSRRPRLIPLASRMTSRRVAPGVGGATARGAVDVWRRLTMWGPSGRQPRDGIGRCAA